MINIDRILHPTDFSQNSAHALNYAYTMAQTFEAELHLVYVISEALVSVSPPMSGFLPEGYYQDVMESAESNLSQVLENDEGLKSGIVRKVIEGAAFVEIIRYAREQDIKMIVMGTHGYSGLMHLLMGSVAENVVRKAPCPVLTVHPEDHRFEMP